jgi:hypothetical protein
MAAILVFAMVAYFVPQRDGGYPILRVLLSLLAGFAGWFISGLATFNLATKAGGYGQMAVSGSTGFALFFAVFYGMRKQEQRKPDDSITVVVDEKFTFADTARMIAGKGKNVRYEGFSDEQVKTSLKPAELGPCSTLEALRRLGHLADVNKFPDYDVTYNDPIYVLKVRGG